MQDTQSLCTDFWVGDSTFHGGDFKMRKKKGVLCPTRKFQLKPFLGAFVLAEDPNTATWPNLLSSDQGNQKRLRGLNHVLEYHMLLARSDLFQFIANFRRILDQLEKVIDSTHHKGSREEKVPNGGCE